MVRARDLSPLWRSRGTRVPVGGRPLRLHCMQTGAPEHGAPLVLVHGMASSWRQWRSTMLRVALPLAALDLPGFGDSEVSRRALEAGDYAEACEAWCRAQGWPALAAVGHSFGGAVVLDWASRYPERFTTLGLLAPAALFHPWFTAGYDVLRLPVLGPLLIPAAIWAVSTRTLGRRAFGHIVSDLTALGDREIGDLQWGCRRAREMRRALDYYRYPDLEERLARIRVPVSLGWGKADRVVPVEDAAFYGEHLPECRTTIWEGCGHLPFLERPAECDAWLHAVWNRHLALAAVQ